ncbi:carbohydrate-binding family 9-like protein [Euzebyella saccharophila]|uniref:Carbohydrate-binding family 9-like protein n=1 Tax=Euzebyella saccharophila TaxID=679664 RepID=A0ABV8JP64_9FLAO|nr:carbohydrate-binding family 9-like protein [Euzebyella saccharophila]
MIVRIFVLSALLIQMKTMSQTEMNKGKTLMVKEITSNANGDLKQVSDLLEKHTDLQKIATINWDSFLYLPTVQFRIARHQNEIWLKFYVEEAHILAQFSEANSATHKDSCVEFFIDPLQNGNYYNFEFNCIGTTHLAYGPGRGERQFVDKEVIENYIKTSSSLGDEPFEEKSGNHTWEMTVLIPIEVWTFTKNINLQGLTSRANFYKCADDTSKPHYVTWNAVGTERPDFHRPEFFGTLKFD